MSNQPEPLDLDAIEARANAATPWPWECKNASHGARTIHAGARPLALVYITETSVVDNIEFIVHAREDVPALVAEVRRLREREAKLRELHAPVPIYQECGHEHEEEEPGKVFATTIGLTCNYRYDVCNACCISASAQYDDEPFLEICEEHRHRPDTPICKTREILDA